MDGGPWGFDLAMALDVTVALAVVAGVIFALAELRHATRSRRDHAAVSFETTPLLTVEETLSALEKASSISYRPPGDAG
jgi:hypothetical protein